MGSPTDDILARLMAAKKPEAAKQAEAETPTQGTADSDTTDRTAQPDSTIGATQGAGELDAEDSGAPADVVLAFPDKFADGANSLDELLPNPPKVEHEAQVCTLSEMLSTNWATDCHFVSYFLRDPDGDLYCRPLTGQERKAAARVNKPALHSIEQANWSLVAWGATFDLDLKDNRPAEEIEAEGKGWTQDRLEWFAELCNELIEKMADKGTPIHTIYRTNHGARFIHRYDQLQPVEDHEQILEGLRKRYLAYGVAMDEACSDWTRLMRAPRVIRDDQATGDQWWFSCESDDDAWTVTSLCPRSERPKAANKAHVPQYDGKRPDPDQCIAFFEEYRETNGGRQRCRTPLCLSIRKRITRMDNPALLAALDDMTPYPFEIGAVNTDMTKLVGSLCGRLFDEPYMEGPEPIYALLLSGAEQLQDSKNDWPSILWSLCVRMWTGEAAQAKAVEIAEEPTRNKLRDIKLRDNDSCNAEIIYALNPDTLRIDIDRGVWVSYDAKQGVWIPGKAAEPRALALTACLESTWLLLAKDADKQVAALEQEGAHADVITEAKKLAKARRTIAKKAGNIQTRKHALEALKADSRLHVSSSQFDADPYMLNFTNGILDLRTSAFRDHDPKDYCTKQTNVQYDPDATCARWDSFLREILVDPEVREYICAAFSLALLGIRPEQKLHVLYGGGSNGKSVFLDTLLWLLGSYGVRPAASLLMRQKNDKSTHDAMMLLGARLAVMAEVQEGASLDEATTKRLTGDVSITARNLFEQFITFPIVASLWLSTNDKPVVRETGEAMWRRLLLVPFTQTIPDDQQDLDLIEKLKAEGPGILNWALGGLRQFFSADGLHAPDAIRAATDEYRRDSDLLGRFIEECLIADSQAKTRVSEIYALYRSWCDAEGLHPMSNSVFGRKLTARGYDKRKSHGVSVYQGLKLHGPHLPKQIA